MLEWLRRISVKMLLSGKLDRRPRLTMALYSALMPFVNKDKYLILIDNRDRKSVKQINQEIRRMFACEVSFHFTPMEYRQFKFETKSWHKIGKYMSGHERKELIIKPFMQKLDNENLPYVIADKYSTWKLFRDRMLREAIMINGADDWDRFQEFCSKHANVFIKPLKENNGNGVEMLNTIEVDLKGVLEKMLSEYDGKWIVEEVLKQAKEMAEFHESSVNTIRLTTCIKDGKNRVLWAYLRTGCGGSNIDNSSKGGWTSFIDSGSGIVTTIGRNKLKLEESETHPDSGKRFKGFQVPRWHELLDIAFELHHRIPWYNHVGWDFALTDNGWAVIECNIPSLNTVQYFSHKPVKQIFREAGIIK